MKRLYSWFVRGLLPQVMCVLMLTWEYPPKIVGGISRHVYDLVHALTAQGVEVHFAPTWDV